jgi:putative transposase
MAKNNDNVSFKKLLLQFMSEPDPLFSMLQWMTERLMMLEAENKVGAPKGKHSKMRTTHFSETRVRRFDTRLGTMYLLVPKLRNGGYIPFFVTEKKRSEQALIQVVQEAFINGVSTRKIEHLAKSLGIDNLSASQVSEINKGLDEQVEYFRTRELEKEYPVIWADAMYEKIRRNGRVVSMAVLVVTGLTVDGTRDILAVEPMFQESEQTYTAIFERLKARGVEIVWLAVSDAHRGIQAAVKKCFLGCSWQRCKVHLMRNILAHVGHRDKAVFAAKLKQIWLQPNKELAEQYGEQIIQEYEGRYPEAINVLEEGLEDSLQFYSLDTFDARKISSTNVLERLNREIRRRSRVVGVFPSEDSYVRLITCYLIEYSEDWGTSRSYIKQETIEELRARQKPAA